MRTEQLKEYIKKQFDKGWKNNYELYNSEGLSTNVDMNYHNYHKSNVIIKTQTFVVDGKDLEMTLPKRSTPHPADLSNNYILMRIEVVLDILRMRSNTEMEYVIVNSTIGKMLIDSNRLNKNSEFSLNINYLKKIGTRDGLIYYIDPDMESTDNRICIFGKSFKDDMDTFTFFIELESE